MRSPVIPYGHAWLEGKLVVEQREYKIILKIMQLWQSGKSQGGHCRFPQLPEGADPHGQEMVPQFRRRNYQTPKRKQPTTIGGPHGTQ